MNKKKIIIFSIAIISFILSIFFITYSLFESVVLMSTDSDIAKWNIKVNNLMITTNESINNSFDIGSINWQNGGHVKPGKAAPGSVGNFTIEIDPTDTQVSFTYQIEFDVSSLNNDQFTIQNVRERNGNEFLRIGENTYVGIVRLNDINNHKKYYIDIDVVWYNSDDNNKNDYEIGSNADDGVYIPIYIELNQYFGNEVFVTYDENGE